MTLATIFTVFAAYVSLGALLLLAARWLCWQGNAVSVYDLDNTPPERWPENRDEEEEVQATVH